MIVALANNSMYFRYCPYTLLPYTISCYTMHFTLAILQHVHINILNGPLPNNIVNIIINICFPVCIYISIFSCAAVIGTSHKCLWLWNKYILLLLYFT